MPIKSIPVISLCRADVSILNGRVFETREIIVAEGCWSRMLTVVLRAIDSGTWNTTDVSVQVSTWAD